MRIQCHAAEANETPGNLIVLRLTSYGGPDSP